MSGPPPADSSMAEKFQALRQRLFEDVHPTPPPQPPRSPPPPPASRPETTPLKVPAASPAPPAPHPTPAPNAGASAPRHDIAARGRTPGPTPDSSTPDSSSPAALDPLSRPVPGARSLAVLESGQEASPRPTSRRALWFVLCSAAVILAVVVAGTAWILWRTPNGDSGAISGADESTDVGRSRVAQAAVVRLDTASSTVVSVRLHLGEPTSLLTVSVPPASADLGLTVFSPVVSHVRVTADGEEIGATVRSIQPGDSVDLFLSRPTRSPVIEYRADGVVARSRPAPPGRASLLVSPLSVDTTRALSTRVRVMSLEVLNVGCVSDAHGSESCGHQVGEGWIITRNPADSGSQVIASVNLLDEASSPPS